MTRLIHRRSRLSHLRATRTHLRTSVNYSDRYIASMAGRAHERIGERVTPSRVALGGWRREKLRQGLLTDSDGYHFIRDTILRLPQPTSLPSPPSMLFARPIWSDLILVALIHHLLSARHLPSHIYHLEYTTWSRPLNLPSEIFLTFSCFCFPPKST